MVARVTTFGLGESMAFAPLGAPSGALPLVSAKHIHMNDPGGMPANLRELETLLATIREVGAELLNLEMYERWGNGADADMNRALANAGEQHARCETARTQLASLVARLRSEDPRSVAAWADAHITLLERFLETCTDGTARFVATEEISGWTKVKQGSLAFVDENTFYVRCDPELRATLLGV